MEQLLLQPMSGLKVGQRSRACLRHPDGSSVEAPQLPRRRRRRPPARHRWNNKPSSIQRPAALGKLLVRHLNGAPVAEADRSRVHPLAWAEGEDLARSHLDPAPDRRWSCVDRKRDQHHARGHRDKGDARLFLLDSRQSPAVKPNLGQSRAELATAGDQQAGDAVRAQSRLKILRFTKYRRAAARHSASPPMPEAVPPARGARSDFKLRGKAVPRYSITANAPILLTFRVYRRKVADSGSTNTNCLGLRHVVANFATFVCYCLYCNDVVDRDPLKEKLMPVNFLQKQAAVEHLPTCVRFDCE
jgi:hypothetical protein